MANEAAAVAESQPAETQDVFNGETPSLAEFSHYRATGELPERFKPAETVAEAAAADEIPEGEEPETAPASEPESTQEKQGKRKTQTAEERIAQLEQTIEKIKRGAGLERKAEVAPATEQPKTPPQNYAEWRKGFKPSEWVTEYAKANPEATYEEATAAMADFLGDVRDQFKDIETKRSAQAQEMSAKIAEAKQRYGDVFEDVVAPAVATIISDTSIPPFIKEMINKSDVVADLVFTLGSDEKTLRDFQALARTNPVEAVKYLAIVENEIVQELSGAASKPAAGTPRDDAGKFTAPPAKQKTTAPKPPAPVTGASTGAFDVSDESLPPEEWARKRRADLAKRGQA